MRGFLLGMVLVFWSLPASAGPVAVSWDYPVAWQKKVTFVAHIVSTRQGQVQTRDDMLPLIWTGITTCGAFADQVDSPETMCARLCLEPDLYTVQVRATAIGFAPQISMPPVDLDVRDSGTCQPALPTPVVVSSPPPAQPPGQTTDTTTKPFVDKLPPIPPPPIPAPDMTPTINLVKVVNQRCVEWRVTGACLCGFPPHPCVTVEYYEPAYLIETVKRPGTTMIPGASQILGQTLGQLGLWGGAGAGNASGQGHTNIHYTEVHVWNFPQLLGGPCTSCAARTIPLALHYASELDAVSWRTSVAPNTLLTTILQVGSWGPKFPRQGKVIHGSPSVASALAAVRALDIVHLPVAPPPNADAHIVTLPNPGLPAEVACLQMGSPRQLPCLQAGTPPPVWENGTVDVRGNYLWIVWERRQCCVEVGEMTCGITLPGVGSQGGNFCALTPPAP